ncbi:peptidase M50 [Carbonactinospora thermoautotrophica]|uniref:Zinc metalloprotease n=1 Tax=Carbonactinospora thermoautotrophica TaxID=1469144 RepID=A0A132MHD6_9ACTN|nr:site-2 protease family protein [Carbonactinospora thermoautotrophica]KWW97247.1 Peptidase M50 [Carbonactinospora thermoautotrophica]KWX00433.1 peptidase M50 [Carbonactinospora thermoautotrophica]KWX10447.1 peptidase M50 [Carbonactinospora thermoautotrophica]
MRDSLRIGRIAGIRVGFNISVLVIVVILVVGLALGRFPATFPGRSPAAYLLAALVTAFVFLLSLLAHELAHAIVARRNGIEVEGITLWLFGGVAQLRGEPRTPGADFRVAVVGPLTSLVLALVFGLAAALVAAVAEPGLTVSALMYLAVVNVMLAVFNLIPAAPLDGGRVLRAFLWWRSRDRLRAAVTAARAGRVFGYTLIGLGFLQLVVGLGFGGLWLALIGLFLVNAATAEEQQTQANAALHGIRVIDVMTRNPVTASPEEPLSLFIDRTVLTHRFSTYPLVDTVGRLSGLVTLNRIRAVAPERRAVTRLGDIACPPDQVPVARPEEPLTDLLPRMAGCPDGRAVVVDASGVVIGLITPSDISRALQLRDLRPFDPYPTPRGADVSLTHHRHAA